MTQLENGKPKKSVKLTSLLEWRLGMRRSFVSRYPRFAHQRSLDRSQNEHPFFLYKLTAVVYAKMARDLLNELQEDPGRRFP